MTRYYIDSEFIDDGRTIDLVSIGLVAEDGREYYAQSVEFDDSKANLWIREHVLYNLDLGCTAFTIDSRHDVADMRDNHLLMNGVQRHRKLYPTCPWRRRSEIAQDLVAFCDPEKYGEPEFIGWCAGFDFVVLCQLFGTMMDLPAGWSHYICDLQQILDDRGISDNDLPEQEEGLHNALADAKHLKKLWGYIVRNDCWQ